MTPGSTLTASTHGSDTIYPLAQWSRSTGQLVYTSSCAGYFTWTSTMNNSGYGGWLAELRIGSLTDLQYSSSAPQVTVRDGATGADITNSVMSKSTFDAYDTGRPVDPNADINGATWQQSLNWPFDINDGTGNTWVTSGTTFTLRQAFQDPYCGARYQEADLAIVTSNLQRYGDADATMSLRVAAPENPAITVVKKINGDDADAAPGVAVDAGSTMNITYEVKNTGNVTLDPVTVTDDKVANVSCPQTSLAADATMTCTATLAAPAAGVQHTDTATVHGTSPTGKDVTDTNPANAYTPGITIVKKINGSDANTAPGVSVTAGSTMNITYDVTNTGLTPLSAVSVTDAVTAGGGTAPTVSCPQTTLAAGATMQCTATMTAPAAGVQHTDVATVTGQPPANPDGSTPPKVTDDNPANALPTPAPKPAVTIVKSINGQDADVAPGVSVVEGATMDITYVVTNTGNTDLTGVAVTDKVTAGGTAAPSDLTCPATTLAAGASMTCTATMTAPAAGVQHTDVATVTGTSPDGTTVTDDNPANALPTATPKPGVSVVKKINGDDAETAPGVAVAPGSTMNITFDVENTGNVDLTGVTVTDDKVTGITCPQTDLAAGATMQCTATLAAPAVGTQHTDTATVTGTPPSGPPVTDTNKGNAYTPGISIVKSINGDDADTAPGVTVAPGSTMNITYEVTNTGLADLTAVAVTDAVTAGGGTAPTVTCPQTTLTAGASMTCTATMAAPAAGTLHTDVATVTGQPPANPDGSTPPKVTDDNPANATTSTAPAITIIKKINGDDADAAPGVSVVEGSTMDVTMDVTNSGDVPLTNVTVTDDKIAAGSIVCPSTTLAVGATMQCTATYPAPAAGVQHTNTATVVGTAPDGKTVTDNNPANATGTATPAPGISIVKSINGDDADTAPGVTVAPGSTMNITYLVTNTGNTALSGVAVTDAVTAGGGTAPTPSCPQTDLAAGASMTCTATMPAPAAGTLHTDVATVTGQPPVNPDGTTPPKVTDDNPANATSSSAPAITIVKKINGDDANAAPGVSVVEGSAMAITYDVTNTGDTALTNVTVTDDKVAAGDITCPATTLAPGATFQCTATFTAPAAGVQHTNTGTVVGTAPDGTTVTAKDPANAMPTATPAPAIQVVKSINGDDADTAPGVSVVEGSTMNITYVVTNTGNTALSGVSVTDAVTAGGGTAPTPSCPQTDLAAGASMTCTATMTAPAAGTLHTDVATVTGQPPVNPDGSTPPKVTDDNPANATPTPTPAPAIEIVKSINGLDADTAPGASVVEGSTMNITYVVTNTGNTALTGVTVTDAVTAGGGTAPSDITCSGTTLAAGASMTCTATMTAPAAGVQHTDVATVVGTPPANADGTPWTGPNGETTVTDDNPANALPTATPAPAISIVKAINGDDANTAPGVSVTAGAPMDITYVVTNTGNTALTGVAVTDAVIAGGGTAPTPSCAQTTLAAGESMQCTATMTAPAAGVQHTDVATVVGTPPANADGTPWTGPNGETTVTDDNPANATPVAAAAPKIDVVKKINGNDANTAPGVAVEAGQPMTITYTVTNTGNVALTDVALTDDKVTAIDCKGLTTLAVGESFDCTATLPAPAAGVQHTNTVTATGVPPKNPDGSTPPPVTDEDKANAYVPGITVVKSINGDDADTAPGVSVEAGSTMEIAYEVTNTGLTPLTNVLVTDKVTAGSTAGPADLTCPADTLAAGESMTCTATMVAPAAGVQHTDVATVVGTPPVNPDGTQPPTVTDDNPANALPTPAPSSPAPTPTDVTDSPSPTPSTTTGTPVPSAPAESTSPAAPATTFPAPSQPVAPGNPNPNGGGDSSGPNGGSGASGNNGGAGSSGNNGTGYTPSSPSSNTGLAYTGAQVAGTVGLAAALLAIGGGLVAAGRRRRDDEQD